MPRSKRRKGVKRDGRRHIDGNKVARYYDPSSQPKAPTLKNLVKRGASPPK